MECRALILLVTREILNQDTTMLLLLLLSPTRSNLKLLSKGLSRRSLKRKVVSELGCFLLAQEWNGALLHQPGGLKTTFSFVDQYDAIHSKIWLLKYFLVQRILRNLAGNFISLSVFSTTVQTIPHPVLF